MLNGIVIDDTKLFNERLREGEDFYNYNSINLVARPVFPRQGGQKV